MPEASKTPSTLSKQIGVRSSLRALFVDEIDRPALAGIVCICAAARWVYKENR